MNSQHEVAKALPAPSRRSVTLGSSIQILIRIFGLISGAIVVAVQARTLSVADFGNLSTILLISGMAVSLADLGLLNTAVQRMAMAPENRRSIVSALLLCRLALGLALTAGAVALSFVLFTTLEARMSALIIVAGIPLSSVSALQSLPMAGLRLLPQNVLLFFQSFVWTLVVLGLGLAHANLVGFAIGFTLSAVVQSTITLVLCGPGYRFRFSEALVQVKPLMRRAIPLGLGALGVTAYYRLTGLVLFSIAGATAAASYSAAFRIVDVIQVIPSTVLAPLIPLLAAAFSAGRTERAHVVWSLSSRVMFSLACMSATGIAILAAPIVDLLYGPAYSDSVGLMRIVAFAFIPISMGWLTTGVVTAAGAVRGYAAVTIVGAILSVSASLVLVPVYGAYASAWITVATEFAVVTSLSVLVHMTTGLRFPFWVFLRVLLATVVMALVVYVMGWPPLGVLNSLGARVAAGVGIGGAALFLLRVITTRDLRSVLSSRGAHE